VVYPGELKFQMAENITALPLGDVAALKLKQQIN